LSHFRSTHNPSSLPPSLPPSQFRELNEAIVAVIEYLGMQPCDGTAALGKAGATTHNLHLYEGREGGREGGMDDA